MTMKKKDTQKINAAGLEQMFSRSPPGLVMFEENDNLHTPMTPSSPISLRTPNPSIHSRYREVDEEMRSLSMLSSSDSPQSGWSRDEFLRESLASVHNQHKRHRQKRRDNLDEILRSSAVSSRMSFSFFASSSTQQPQSQSQQKPQTWKIKQLNKEANGITNINTNNTTKATGIMYDSMERGSLASNAEEQLKALRGVLGDWDEDGNVARSSLAEAFRNTKGSVFDDYRKGDDKINARALLLDACLDMEMDKERKLKFIFDLFDPLKVGSISKKQVEWLLQSTFESAKLQVVGMDYDKLSSLLFQKVGMNDKQLITFAEFKMVFQHYVVGNEPKETNHRKTDDKKKSIAEFVDSNQLRIIWLLIYTLANLAAFLIKWYAYEVDSVVGYGIKIARGCAQVVMLNYLLVLLPMCRSIITLMKRSRTLWQIIPFDDGIEFHKISGTVCCLAGLVHSGAHVSNVYHLYAKMEPDEWAKSIFAKIPGMANGLIPFHDMLLKLPILTGVIILLITLISFPIAVIPKLRQGNFNLFWYSHMFFIPFLVVGAIHGALSWLATAESYWWIVPPLLIYLVERRHRYGAATFSKGLRIMKADVSEKTLALHIETPKRFTYLPGMYLFLNMPQISAFEWHPFTISSAPGDAYVGVHIREAGDWTAEIIRRIEECNKMNVPYPLVYIDGPVGAPTEDYVRYRTVVLVGAGIGVTPFASILKHMVHLWNDSKCHRCNHVQPPRNLQVEKIYFYWTTRGQESLGWFRDTMDELTDLDIHNHIEAHQYLTSVSDDSKQEPLRLFQAFAHQETGQDIVSGLKTKHLTHFGRPNWDKIFQQIAKNHPQEEVGVFYCGPHALEKILAEKCQKYSTSNGTFFDYHSEKFS